MAADARIGLVAYQWQVHPLAGNPPFTVTEFDNQVGKWTLLTVPPGNTLVNGQIVVCEIAPDGLTATFTAVVAQLGSAGPRADVTPAPLPPGW